MAVETLERDGVDYRAETGTGFVSKVEHDPAKRNAQVHVTAEGLQYPLKAWCDTKGPVWADVQRAFEQQVRVEYRIEVKRSRGVPADRPWGELTPKDKLRDLVSITRAGSGAAAPSAPAQGPPASQAAATPDRPAAAATAPPAGTSRPAPDPDPVAALARLAEALTRGVSDEVDAAIGRCRRAGCEEEQIHAVLDGNKRAERSSGPSAADEPWTAPAPPPTERENLLRGGLMRLRELNRAKADEAVIDEQRALVVELGATLQQLRWAADLDPATGEPLSQLPAATLTAHADPDKTGIASPHFPPGAPAGERPAPAASSGLGTRAGAPRGYEDPPPYKRTYETGPLAGQLNPSSYEVGVVLELVGLAQKLLIRRARAHAEAHAAPVVAPTLEEVRELAQKLLLAADRVQKALRGGSVDRQSGLYRRVRWAVQESIDWYPWPGADDLEAEHAWHQVVVEHATTTVRVGLELLAGDISGEAPAAT